MLASSAKIIASGWSAKVRKAMVSKQSKAKERKNVYMGILSVEHGNQMRACRSDISLREDDTFILKATNDLLQFVCQLERAEPIEQI